MQTRKTLSVYDVAASAHMNNSVSNRHKNIDYGTKIRDCTTMTIRVINDDERKLWDRTHRNKRYSCRVFSLLDSNLVLEKIKASLKKMFDSESAVHVLIPGCGSNPNIQMCCREIFGDSAVIDALDWSQEAIDISKTKTDGLGINVSYFRQSYYDLSLTECSYDLIILSNAIVSQSNENNILAMQNLTKLLKKGGHFMGFFPSPFNMLDYALTNPDARKWISDGTIDVENRIIHEDNFGNQRFFSPLELYVLFRDLNLRLDAFELFFYDDCRFAKQISELYNLSYRPDYCFWGYFVNTTMK